MKRTPSRDRISLDLQQEKTRLEIEQLKRPWWKNSTNWFAALPTLLAILSLAYVYFSGYFQATSIKMENQKHDLEVDIEKFKAEKTRLKNQISKLSDEAEQRNQTAQEVVDSVMHARELKKTNEGLQEENKGLQAQIEALKKNCAQ